MNGTYGFVYSGVRGVGLGVFTIRNSVFLGSDTGGARYSGHAVQDMATGAVTILFEMFVTRRRRSNSWHVGARY